MPKTDDILADLRFEAEIIYWRGPSPFFFAPLPPDEAAAVRQVSRAVTYGWGMIPVEGYVGSASFTTALFPQGETYLAPLKAAVRRKAGITAGDRISVRLVIRPPQHA